MQTTTRQKNNNCEGMLSNKVALVTGASRGIGAAAAKLFAEEGALITLIARTEEALRSVVEDITAKGGRADYIVADLANSASIERAVQMTVERHGRLDIAFNNVGILIPVSPLAEVKEEDFDLLNAVNYKGIWVAMKAEIKAMLSTAGAGAILNNSSVGSFIGNPGLSAYAASKRAVNSLTETAAIEYGPAGIRVNAIAPGTTMTEMIEQWVAQDPAIIEKNNSLTPLRRAADPNEIAQAAAWLLSDHASYITGVVLPVDGGRRA
ncbi:SDR family NAD(P)-dependent oxidoreductase [Paenibacillus sp. FSL H7-0331]|uniref:SDR family NAD(P)-dependent oxidoreductase n=1 Tax=Paenibacillus sp. FSL H7-0331 TaxID=1920421 RepID=UPI00096C275A|nr:SDR family NAD(P)-dependent oxidoreductase [Paenibacillus sp. FSL H7-0331]OMF11017.1 short-chain dehydrogenase [Paenibacillus sp. FSL H7-0331]